MSKDMFRLDGRIALVTGASRGLGKEIALTLATAGADVVVTARRLDALGGTVDAVRAAGRRAWPLPLEVTDPESVRSLFAAVGREAGALDVLVNNAGINIPRPPFEVTPEEWDRVLQTNLHGLFLCCQEAGRRMVKQRRGKIINISSLAGLIAYPDRAAYAASKAGVIGLTRQLALEWAPYGVTVNCVAPTFVPTDLTASTLADPAKVAQIQRGIPLGRLCTAADVAAAVIFFASPAADFITGVTLPVDGGYHIR
ncbi:MAG: SDR family oxidoreductase [Armatimonadetes bacterium]|nr:SDR family oxidoreductase [Armatimonadota bacterium]